MTRTLPYSLSGFIVIVATLVADSASAGEDKGSFRGDADRGKSVYENHCAVCHGVNGDGAGKEAHRFKTNPTDFVRGEYKFKSTYPGSLPLSGDLYRSVAEGIRGTGMLAQLHLTDDERRDVVAFIMTLSHRFRENPAPAPAEKVVIPQPPSRTPDMISSGARLYRDAGCDKCHGTGGRGDGPSAQELRDSRENPVQLPDLTKLPRKMGDRPEDLYRILITGMEGTPMPSYKGALNESQLWALVYHLESIATGRYDSCMGMMGRMMDMVGEECIGMQIDMPAARAKMMKKGMGPGMMRRMRR